MGPGLLLLLLPWGALGNVGGSAGACACTHRWPRQPPPAVLLPPLAPRVLRAELCPNHVRRFVLPHKLLCGLQDSPWVVELLQLWKRQAARRPVAGPPATNRPPDRRPVTGRPTDGPPPPDRPLATDGPSGGATASPLAPRSPPAPEGPPTPLNGGEGQRDRSGGQLPGGPQALLPTPAGWIHREAVGQDPQTPPPAVGLSPLSMGLAAALVLLGAGLGLGGALACRGGCRAGRGRGPRPPPPAEPLMPPSCPPDPC